MVVYLEHVLVGEWDLLCGGRDYLEVRGGSDRGYGCNNYRYK